MLKTLGDILDKFNPLPNDKILDWSKFKAFADNKMNASQELKTIYGG